MSTPRPDTYVLAKDKNNQQIILVPFDYFQKIRSYVIRPDESYLGGFYLTEGSNTKRYESLGKGSEFFGYVDYEAYLDIKEERVDGKWTKSLESRTRALCVELPDESLQATSNPIAKVMGWYKDELYRTHEMEWLLNETQLSPPFSVPIPVDTNGDLQIGGYPDVTHIRMVNEGGGDIFSGFVSAMSGDIGVDKAKRIGAVLDRLNPDIKAAIAAQGGDWWTDWESVRGSSETYWNSPIYSVETSYDKYLEYLLQWERHYKEIESTIESGDASALYHLVFLYPAQVLKTFSVDKKLKILQAFAKEGIEGTYRTFLTRPNGTTSFFYKSSPKEFLVIKILESVDESNLTEVDAFLEGITHIKPYGSPSRTYAVTVGGELVSLFEAIYQRVYGGGFWDNTLDFFFGDNDKGHQLFINCTYDLWIKSKYNPYRAGFTVTHANNAFAEFDWHPVTSPETIDFNIETSWMGDDPNFSFEFTTNSGKRKIRAKREPIKTRVAVSEIDEIYNRKNEFQHPVTTTAYLTGVTFTERRTYYYDILQPVGLMLVEDVDGVTVAKLPFLPTGPSNTPDTTNLSNFTTVAPVFLLKYISDKMDFEIMRNRVGVAVDIALTLTAVGNIAKLRHLKKALDLTKTAARVIRVRLFLNWADISLNTINYLTNYFTANCSNNSSTTCQKVTAVTTILAVAAGGADGLIESTKLSKAVDDLIAHADNNPSAFANFTDNGKSWSDIKAELQAVSASQIANGFGSALVGTFNHVKTWFDSSSDLLKAKFSQNLSDFTTNPETRAVIQYIEDGLAQSDNSRILTWEKANELSPNLSRRRDAIETIDNERAVNTSFDENVMEHSSTRETYKATMHDKDLENLADYAEERLPEDVVEESYTRLKQKADTDSTKVKSRPKWFKEGKEFEVNQIADPPIGKGIFTGPAEHADYTRLKSWISTNLGANLDEYNIFTGVQVKIPGITPDVYCIPDILPVKVYKQGDETFYEVLFVDFKLSSGTNVTKKQGIIAKQDALVIRGGDAAENLRPSSITGYEVLDISSLSKEERSQIVFRRSVDSGQNVIDKFITAWDGNTDSNGNKILTDIVDFGLKE